MLSWRSALYEKKNANKWIYHIFNILNSSLCHILLLEIGIAMNKIKPFLLYNHVVF